MTTESDSMALAKVLARIAPWTSSQSKLASKCHKGMRGRIGIVGGGRDYVGAPCLASISAMRVGADLAYVICASTASQAIKCHSLDLVVMPMLDCPEEATFKNELSCLLERLHAIVIGPGLGREELLQKRAKHILLEAKTRSIPLVIDADGLILVNEDISIIKGYEKALLTPNRIELQRMLNVLYSPKTFDLRDINSTELAKLVKQCSKDLNVSILAKGMTDFSSDPDGFQLATNEKSGSDRRCGGQGDILSGVAGTYSYWIEQANKAAGSEKISHQMAWAGHLAAATTRRCNEIAKEKYQDGFLASDMVGSVYEAFKSLTQKLDVGENEFKYSYKLTQDEIVRFNRQMIMDQFGPSCQMKLKEASAIIIGAGGLGCPVAAYLGAGGIGRLGIVDDDKVEVSNLHRQILHNTDRVGWLKTDSIKAAVHAINPNVKIDTYPERLTRHNAVKMIQSYDIVIDATDNSQTRYMIGDACVVAKKPLVSGAALQMYGQLTVYNYDQDTPCYRCLNPTPTPANALGSCSDNGVLGVVPGIIGVHQALEAIKIGAGLRPAYAGSILLFDGQSGRFRVGTLSGRKPDCEACGHNSKLGPSLIDYEEFCSAQKCQTSGQQVDQLLDQDERITVEQYRDILKANEPHVLVDVRPYVHSDISRFDHAIQLPVAEMLKNQEESLQKIETKLKSLNTNLVYVVCRRGIASQRGTRIIQDLMVKRDPSVIVKDIIGGMTAWSKQIDASYSCL